MRTYNLIPISLILALTACAPGPGTREDNEASAGEGPESLTLARYRPESAYHIPKTMVEKPAWPIIDMHSHDYAASAAEIDAWVRTMDKLGIEKTVILSIRTGEAFDSVVAKYAAYPDRFELWCGIDYTGYGEDPSWNEHAVRELERCHAMGARGVGELGDKGQGLLYSKPTPGYGLHMDDPSLKPVWETCARLDMPVNVHVAEPYWMYLPMDSTNDGLMNAYTWQVDMTKEGILDHDQLIGTLERTVRDNPQTTFIACHFANCSYDLDVLGGLLDKYPNLWADISARYAETAPIPRTAKAFYEKYQDRLLYGTDMGMDEGMYRVTFRILETEDEHFYERDLFGYHWALNGFGLPGGILEKVYNGNARKIQKQD
ncbi:MAG: amidohydrolase family protein [Bacteroidales bacterium]